MIRGKKNMKFKVIPNQQTPKVGETVVLPNDKKLLEKFISFARLRKNCAGLAANQVSMNGERIMKPFFAIKNDHRWELILNPGIIEYIGEPEEKIEGCLTWLGRKIAVERYPSIEVEYVNLKNYRVHETLTGFQAQVFQHEYNHLMGIEEKFLEE